jgi:hypothetical protein
MNDQDKQRLRDLSTELVRIRTSLDDLNVQRNVLLSNKEEIEKSMILIIEKPEFNAVNQLSVGDKTIKVIRQHNKPWTLSKGRVRTLVYDFARINHIDHQVAQNLVQHIYTEVEEVLKSNEMKLELR